MRAGFRETIDSMPEAIGRRDHVRRAGGPRHAAARQPGGFTLLEGLLMMAIIAILVALALPSFQDQLRKSRRSDAIEALSLVQFAQEKYRSSNTAYSPSLTTLGFASSPLTSSGGYYSVDVSGTSATGYTVTATPVAGGAQESDILCPSIVLTVASGTITHGPSDLCWNR